MNLKKEKKKKITWNKTQNEKDRKLKKKKHCFPLRPENFYLTSRGTVRVVATDYYPLGLKIVFGKADPKKVCQMSGSRDFEVSESGGGVGETIRLVVRLLVQGNRSVKSTSFGFSTFRELMATQYSCAAEARRTWLEHAAKILVQRAEGFFTQALATGMVQLFSYKESSNSHISTSWNCIIH